MVPVAPPGLPACNVFVQQFHDSIIQFAGTGRNNFRPGMVRQRRQALPVGLKHVAGTVQRRGGRHYISYRSAVAIAERSPVTAPVMIPGVHEIHEPAVQVFRVRHIVMHSRFPVFPVPGEEDHLFAQPRP